MVPLLCWVQAVVLYLGAGTARHRVDRGEDPRQGPTWQQPELAVHIDTLQPFPALCQDGKPVWGLGLLLSLRLSPGLGLAPSHVCRCAGRREGWDQGLMGGVQHRLVGPQGEAGGGSSAPRQPVVSLCQGARVGEIKGGGLLKCFYLLPVLSLRATQSHSARPWRQPGLQVLRTAHQETGRSGGQAEPSGHQALGDIPGRGSAMAFLLFLLSQPHLLQWSPLGAVCPFVRAACGCSCWLPLNSGWLQGGGSQGTPGSWGRDRVP